MQKPKFKEAIANMTFKQKQEYIWEYYKLQIMAAVFLIFLAGFSIYEISQRKEDFLKIAVTGGMTTMENVTGLSEHLSDVLLTEEQKRDYRILVEAIPYSAAEENPSFEYVQKLFVLISAGEIDVLVIDEPTFATLHGEGYFLNLNELEVDLATLETVDRTGEPFGILIHDFEIFQDIFPEQGWILSVVVNSDRSREVERLVEYLIANLH